jgi:hypothetical protein
VSRRDHLRDDVDDADRFRYRIDVHLEEHARRTGWLVDGGWLAPPTDAFRSTAASLDEAHAAAQAARRAAGPHDGPLGDMVAVAERFALYLTVVDLAVDGASLSAGAWGVAVVGFGAEPGRRRMTAAHELGTRARRRVQLGRRCGHQPGRPGGHRPGLRRGVSAYAGGRRPMVVRCR